MGLEALEFRDCLTDSPFFRQNLHAHEKELERTSHQIKNLLKDVKDILSAARLLSRAQRSLAASLESFRFECIGTKQTDDELEIAQSLQEFARLIASIEDERDRLLEKANDQFIKPLDDFRKTKIGNVKEGKKKFEKQSGKFCQSQERYLNLSTKKQDNVLQEADASLEMEQRHFCQASLNYVFLLQEVQEAKKYEFVETLLGFMYGWLTFYHQGHEVASDSKPYMLDLQKRIQHTRENFETTRDETKMLMQKMLELRKSKDPGGLDRTYARQGYLFLMEKKALGTTWTKFYCMYEKKRRKFSMIAYNQVSGKIVGSDELLVKSCVRRMSETIEKRFCFDVWAEGRSGIFYTLQALSEEDRRLWIEAMDGKESTSVSKVVRGEETVLDGRGFSFVERCIGELERRGLEEQGLYRLVGVSSKVSKLLSLGLDGRGEGVCLKDRCEWETKTITSALKTFFRNLPEPIFTFRLHEEFIQAAKEERRVTRVGAIHAVVHRLPDDNFKILDILMGHLHRIGLKSEKNKMTVSNLGVCFGPTLLRPEEESVAAIMDIKFCNVIVEILIDNYDKIFQSLPLPTESGKEGSTSSGILLQEQKPDGGGRSYGRNGGFSSWERLSRPMDQSTTTVDSAHSSSHSSSSTDLPFLPHSVPLPIQPLKGSRLRPKNRTFHSQPFLSKTGDAGVGSESSSSESVASWPGLPLQSHPTHPPPYQPPPDHPLFNGQEYIPRLPKGDFSSGGLSSATKYEFTKCARTLYACTGEHDGELSFEPNEVISNVRPSCEPGWLEGTLRGKTGLIPENYVEPLL